MSFQAYLDNIEAKTGKSADDFRRLAAKTWALGQSRLRSLNRECSKVDRNFAPVETVAKEIMAEGGEPRRHCGDRRDEPRIYFW